jgi:hypothetical protein
MRLFSKFNFPWHIFTTHRVSLILYVIFATFILIAGAVMVGLSFTWLFPYTTQTYMGMSITVNSTETTSSGSLSFTILTEAVSYLNLVLTSTDISIALVTGVLCCITFIASLPAYLTRSTKGLVYLNIVLPFEALAMVGGTGFIWFRSLQERDEFWQVWQNGGMSVQYAIQERWQCCGYWDSSSAAFGSKCASAVPAMPACVDSFQDYGDHLLSGATTFMYTVAIIMGFWFLVNLCLIAEVGLPCST